MSVRKVIEVIIGGRSELGGVVDQANADLGRLGKGVPGATGGAGAGGIAVGVHTTQFAIRDPRIGLFRPVLTLAAETIRHWEHRQNRQVVKIAGICGETPQALQEAGVEVHGCLLCFSATDQ
jgi:hypothetical protein